MPFTDEGRRLGGRIGGLVKASRYPPGELTAKARAAFDLKFFDEVDPDHVLPEAERQRRALAARKAYFARLELESDRARRRAAKAQAAATAKGFADVEAAS